MTYARLDVHEGELLEIGNVPVAVSWARKRSCTLLIPQYEDLDGVSWPTVSRDELRNHAVRLQILIASQVKQRKNDRR